MQRPSTEGGPEPLARPDPSVPGRLSELLLMGFAMSAAGPVGFSLVEETSGDPNAIATVGITATGLFTRGKART